MPWAPTLDLMREDWAAALGEAGLTLAVRSRRAGYAPQGGGEVLALVAGSGRPRAVHREFRGNLRTIRGRAYVSRQDAECASRSLDPMFGLNLGTGGDGSSGVRGTHPSYWMMSCQEILDYGSVLIGLPGIHMVGWKYDEETAFHLNSCGAEMRLLGRGMQQW